MQAVSGTVLVATRSLSDPHFMRTVVYLLEHDAGGTLGFIVNRPLDLKLGDLWGECPEALDGIRIACEGGPVERNKGLLLHACPDIAGCQPMGLGLAVGGELAALVTRFSEGPDGRGPRLFLGHAGWGPGQLEAEIGEGSWVVRPATPEVLLDSAPSPVLWQRLLDGGTLPEPSLN